MANESALREFFENIEAVIQRMGNEDTEREKLLREFFFRVLCVLDGVESKDIKTAKGIALVARENIPSGIEELNDGFLHDIWPDRSMW